MHIHQPINVCSSLLDEQCNNNRFICIFAFTLALLQIIKRRHSVENSKEKQVTLHRAVSCRSFLPAAHLAHGSIFAAYLLNVSTAQVRLEMCVTHTLSHYLHLQPLFKNPCISLSASSLYCCKLHRSFLFGVSLSAPVIN